MHHIALVSQANSVSLRTVATAAAALSKQVMRDFTPLWNIHGTVQAFGSLADVPMDYYPVIIKDDIGDPSAAGFHTDQNNQPYALVQTSSDWTVTASHEILEMLADPFGNQLVAGTVQGKRVKILREVCDPCESFTYTVNGVAVSDFLRPSWYLPLATGPQPTSFLGRLSSPQQVGDGGYFSWLDVESNRWFQLTDFGKVEVVDLGPMGSDTKSFREVIDGATRPRMKKK